MRRGGIASTLARTITALMQSPLEHFHGTAQPIKASFTVQVIAHDRPPLIPAGDHVIQGAGELDSQWACHANILTPSPPHTMPNV